MLNEKLFDDPKDAEIARLKMTIEKFKEYDEERKKYYADNIQRLGELESYVQELEAGTAVETLKKKINELHDKVRFLSKTIQARKIEETRTEAELSGIIANSELRRRNRHLNEQVARLIKERNKWISEQLNKSKQ